MNKILSLNFIKTNKDNNIEYLNPNNFPLLFFWNGEKTIFEEMTNDDNFNELLFNKYCTIENYSFINMYIIDYNIDLNEYKQYNIPIQEFVSINNENLSSLKYKYLETIFIDLYKISMNNEYKLTVESHIDNIINIYTILKDKYKERISHDTLQKYILSQLQQLYKLNMNNCEEIIKVYDEIIS